MTHFVVLEFLNIGGPELTLILLAALLLFGGKKLPELARGIGKGMREFKDASEGIKREIHRNINDLNPDVDDQPASNNRFHPEEEKTTTHAEPTPTEHATATEHVGPKENVEHKRDTTI